MCVGDGVRGRPNWDGPCGGLVGGSGAVGGGGG